MSYEGTPQFLQALPALLWDMVFPVLYLLSVLGNRKAREKISEQLVSELAHEKAVNVELQKQLVAQRLLIAECQIKKSGTQKGDSLTSSSQVERQDLSA